MTKSTKPKKGAKARSPVRRAVGAKAAGARRRPGRPLGSLNRRTIAMREAIATVFDELQRDHGGPGDYSHFFAWAKANPTEFYRIAVRQLPLTVETNAPAVGVVVFRGIND